MASTSPGQHPGSDKAADPARQLAPLVGRWHFDGDVERTAHGPASRWSSEEHCSWLPDHHFIANQWDARVGERDFKGMAVFGHDAARGFFATFYDNQGNHPTYEVHIEGAAWTLAGESQRAFYDFARDGATVRIRWEVRGDKGWQPLCDLTGRRITSH